MRLVLQVGGAEIDVDVSAAASATVGQLAEALAGGPVGPGTGLVAGSRFLSPSSALAGAGLRQGDAVRLSPGPPSAPEPVGVAAAELHVTGGLAAGRRVSLVPGPVVVGRETGHGVGVGLESATVSARHARLVVRAGGSCTIADLGSRNGTRVDGRFVSGEAAVAAGALVQLGAVQVGLVPAPVAPASDRAALGPPGAGSGTTPFNRPPRRMMPAGPTPVAVPVGPAERAPGVRLDWAMLLAPLVIGGVMAVVFAPIMAAFALFSPVMAVGTWWEDRRRVARERERNKVALATALAAFRADLATAAAAEARRRALLLPDPAETLRRAEGPSTRLWERRGDAADVLRLRLGVADVAWQPPLAEGHGARLPEVAAAVADASTLVRSPVEADVSPGHAVGVVGPRPAVVALLRSLACQAAVHHGPADVAVAVLADEAAAPDWDWAKWLPHAAGLCAVGRHDAEALAAAWPRSGGPVLLAVVDGDGFTEGRVAPVRDLLAGGKAGAIVVASSADRLPALCTTVVELVGPDGVATVSEPSTASVIGDVLVAGVGEDGARRCARALAALDDPEAGDGSGGLPDTVPLLGLLGLGDATAGAVAGRWHAASATSLAAVVGAGHNGPLVLDLVADGPHALVAGTTGAGKSELLRTLVASLASSYGPDRLTFVLIDYKGGSAFADCARLPHVVGLVTDLDEQLGARALRSLEAELRHREAVLARAGAADLDGYAAVAGRRPEAGHEPLPRLVVMVDEFATMAAELPDFVDSLVGIAQRGRSLGVHLVLATQRPSGAVSDSIRANTNLRVALRVQDVPDSTDVLGTPQAAAIDRRRSGRGFVRLGHAEVIGFQVALVTTVSPPDTGASVRAHPFAFASDGPGAAARADGAGDPTDLVRLVDAARAAFEAARPARPPRRPWLEPLPSSLDLGSLPPGSLGLADEPDAQRQLPYRWQPPSGNLLLYGMAGSGTTTALASITLALVAAGRPVHLYVLDFGNGALAPLAGLAEVGAVVAAGERERQERLVRMLRAELERRRVAVASGGATAWPALVLLVDNLGGLCAAFDDVAGMQVRDDLARLLADGPPLGMAVVASADRPGAVPLSMSAVVQERLVFRLADPYDDTVFGLPAAAARRGPGRAVDAGTGREVQVALPAPGGLDGLVAAVASAPRAAAVPPPPPVGVLPTVVGLHEVREVADLDGPEWFLPVGVGDASLGPVGLRLGEGDHALVAGPARAGKSTVLCVLAEVVGDTRPDVGVWAIAPRRSPLHHAPGVTTLVTDPAMVAGALADIAGAAGPQLVLVDDADTLDDPTGAFAAFFAARRPDVHLVAAARADAVRGAYGHWVAQVRRSRLGIALRPHLDLDGDLWHTVLPRRGPDRFDTGRGYLVCEGSVELVQTAVLLHPAGVLPAAHDPQGARR
ncbi:MAG: FtsK/SpoIIIE domain-containing protein [Acidimicrobiales bacterium]